MKSENYKNAISLVETVLYIAIFSIIFTSIVGFALTIAQSNQNANLRNNIERSAIFLDEHITESFLSSNSIDNNESVFNQNDGLIKIYNSTNSYIYSLSDGRIIIDSNGTQNYLTSPDLNVSKFLIEEVLSPTGSTTGVRISFQINSVNKLNITKSFQTYYSI